MRNRFSSGNLGALLGRFLTTLFAGSAGPSLNDLHRNTAPAVRPTPGRRVGTGTEPPSLLTGLRVSRAQRRFPSLFSLCLVPRPERPPQPVRRDAIFLPPRCGPGHASPHLCCPWVLPAVTGHPSPSDHQWPPLGRHRAVVGPAIGRPSGCSHDLHHTATPWARPGMARVVAGRLGGGLTPESAQARRVAAEDRRAAGWGEKAEGRRGARPHPGDGGPPERARLRRCARRHGGPPAPPHPSGRPHQQHRSPSALSLSRAGEHLARTSEPVRTQEREAMDKPRWRGSPRRAPLQVPKCWCGTVGATGNPSHHFHALEMSGCGPDHPAGNCRPQTLGGAGLGKSGPGRTARTGSVHRGGPGALPRVLKHRLHKRKMGGVWARTRVRGRAGGLMGAE